MLPTLVLPVLASTPAILPRLIFQPVCADPAITSFTQLSAYPPAQTYCSSVLACSNATSTFTSVVSTTSTLSVPVATISSTTALVTLTIANATVTATTTTATVTISTANATATVVVAGERATTTVSETSTVTDSVTSTITVTSTPVPTFAAPTPEKRGERERCSIRRGSCTTFVTTELVPRLVTHPYYISHTVAGGQDATTCTGKKTESTTVASLSLSPAATTPDQQYSPQSTGATIPAIYGSCEPLALPSSSQMSVGYQTSASGCQSKTRRASSVTSSSIAITTTSQPGYATEPSSSTSSCSKGVSASVSSRSPVQSASVSTGSMPSSSVRASSRLPVSSAVSSSTSTVISSTVDPLLSLYTSLTQAPTQLASTVCRCIGASAQSCLTTSTTVTSSTTATITQEITTTAIVTLPSTTIGSTATTTISTSAVVVVGFTTTVTQTIVPAVSSVTTTILTTATTTLTTTTTATAAPSASASTCQNGPTCLSDGNIFIINCDAAVSSTFARTNTIEQNGNGYDDCVTQCSMNRFCQAFTYDPIQDNSCSLYSSLPRPVSRTAGASDAIPLGSQLDAVTGRFNGRCGQQQRRR